MRLYVDNYGNTLMFPRRDFLFYLDRINFSTSKAKHDLRTHEFYSDEVLFTKGNRLCTQTRIPG